MNSLVDSVFILLSMKTKIVNITVFTTTMDVGFEIFLRLKQLE